MIRFKVDGQKLTRTDSFPPATDSEQYLKASFEFVSSDWSGVAKKALFRLGDTVYEKVLANNVCITPSEVLIGSQSRYARITGSTIYVSVVGEYGTLRITTNEIAVKLNISGYADAETPAEPTETIYQQLMTAYADAMVAADANAEAIEELKNSGVSSQEVVDARYSPVSEYTFATLAQRLYADISSRASQAAFEQTMAKVYNRLSALEEAIASGAGTSQAANSVLSETNGVTQISTGDVLESEIGNISSFDTT